MTTSDITIQMNGPYSEAIFATPYRELRTARTQGQRKARNRKTADHPNATPKCMRTPNATVAVPPVNASLPKRTAATP